MLATGQASLSRTTRTRTLRVWQRQVTSTPTVAGPSSLPETRAMLTTVTSVLSNTAAEEGIQNRTDRLVLRIMPCIAYRLVAPERRLPGLVAARSRCVQAGRRHFPAAGWICPAGLPVFGRGRPLPPVPCVVRGGGAHRNA